MAKFFQSILLVTTLIAMLSSCSDDNECDNTCQAGEVQTITCTCVPNANNITPHPCPEQVGSCGANQVLAITDTGCECVDVNTDPGDPNEPAEEVDKTGQLSEDEVWTKDKIYVLNGKVVVPDGVTLDIEAGTVVKGAQGEGSLASALIVAQGGTLNAMGTAEEPIIMTSVLDAIQPGQIINPNVTVADRGLWGGLIVLGKAPISVEGGETATIEGIPADEAFGIYGGSDPDDNSGIIQYISVRHGGISIGSDNEINGITFGGVGAGTTVNNVEVVANKDDGIEFFGGTVNVSNAVVWGQDDDGFDIDQGYSGTVSNFVYLAGDAADHALEIDGPEGATSGAFTLTNGTLDGMTNGEYADFRDGAQGTVMNSYFFGFSASSDFELDGNESSANFFNDILVIENNEINVSHLNDPTLNFEALFKDTADDGNSAGFASDIASDNVIVTEGTVGADLTGLGWTWTIQANF